MAYTPLSSKVDGDTFLTSMWTAIKDNFDALYPGHIICTSSTRPTVGLAEGHMIWETDTNKLLVYDGSVWKDVYPVAAPTGTITQYAGASAPTGYLLCDGSAVSRSTYADLFTILSTSYGAGDGSTTFNLPDLRGRVPVGKGTNADVDELGDSDGVSTVANRKGVIVPAHYHSSRATGADINITSSGSHDHGPGEGTAFLTTSGSANVTSGSGIAAAQHTPSKTASASHTHANSAFSGRVGLVTGGVDGDAAQKLNYLVVNHIIKT